MKPPQISVKPTVLGYNPLPNDTSAVVHAYGCSKHKKNLSDVKVTCFKDCTTYIAIAVAHT